MSQKDNLQELSIEESNIIHPFEFSDEFGLGNDLRRIRGSLVSSALDSYLYEKDGSVKYFFPIRGIIVYEKDMISSGVMDRFKSILIDGNTFYQSLRNDAEHDLIALQQVFFEEHAVNTFHSDYPDYPVTVLKNEGAMSVYQLSFKLKEWGKWTIKKDENMYVGSSSLSNRLKEGLVLEEKIPYINGYDVCELRSEGKSTFQIVERETDLQETKIPRIKTVKQIGQYIPNDV